VRTVLTLLSFAALAAAQAPQGAAGPPNLKTEQVKPGLYMISGAGANTEVRVTNAGLIVVDGKLPGEQNYLALMEQIKQISPQPVKFLIVTHHHPDHAGNDDRFLAAGVPVIAHENFNKNLAASTAQNKPAPASITYDREYKVELGGVTVEVHHFGRAHTSGDSVVYFPDLKVVVTSDEVTPPMPGPLADYAGGGSFLDWPRTMDGMLALDFDTAIPGNGPPISKADVTAFREKVATFVGRAKVAIGMGIPKDQLISHIRTNDLGWTPRVPNVDPFYAEMSAAK